MTTEEIFEKTKHLFDPKLKISFYRFIKKANTLKNKNILPRDLKLDRILYRNLKSLYKSKDEYKDEGDEKVIELKSNQQIISVDDLLEQASIDLEKWDVYKQVVNSWDDKWQVKAWLRKKNKEYNYLRKAGIKVSDIQIPEPLEDAEVQIALVIPDSQNGFIRTGENETITMHDRLCWDLALQLIDHVQPDKIVCLGDNIDFPTLGSFRIPPSLRFLIQKTLDETWWWLLNVRKLATFASIDYIEGNHEKRFENKVIDQLDEFKEIKRAATKQNVLSLPYLLRFDELHINYVSPWKTGLYWNKVFFTHGDKYATWGGQTAGKYLSSEANSIVYGHCHQTELAFRQIHDHNGTRKIFAMSPGTISKIDGSVPAFSQRVDWQQGLGLVYYYPKLDLTVPVLLPITNGTMMYEGVVFRARDRSKEIGEDLGWNV